MTIYEILLAIKEGDMVGQIAATAFAFLGYGLYWLIRSLITGER